MKLGFFPYEAINYKAAQAYLDRKAAQGLALQRIYLGCVARFEKAEVPLHFVDLDLEQARYDAPDRSWKDYFQLCADGGWQYIQNLRGMLLFRAMPGQVPAPIQTDQTIEFDRFWKKYHPRLWRRLLPAAVLTLVTLFFVYYTQTYYRASDLLTTNFGLCCLLYCAATLLFIPTSLVSSRLYLARCRKTDQIEPPGKAAAAVDSFSLFHRLLSGLTVLVLFLNLLSPVHSLHSLREYLSYHADPRLGVNDPAVLDKLEAYPVLTIQGLDLPDSSIRSETVQGKRSLLVQQLRQRENFSVNGKSYNLATDRFQCVSPAVARLLLLLRLQDARHSDSVTWSSDWSPISLPGFEECYVSYNGGHSEYGYFLFRQGSVVAMVGCFVDGSLSPVDLTTPECLAFIQDRILPTS